MGGSLSSRPFYGVCRRVRGCSPGTGSIPECSTRPKIHTKERKSIMGKNIAKLVVKMKSKSLIDIETMGDGANQVFMPQQRWRTPLRTTAKVTVRKRKPL